MTPPDGSTTGTISPSVPRNGALAGGRRAAAANAPRRLGEILAALVLLVLATPLLVTIALAIWIFDGRPILYSGRRLGASKRPFRMHKFRTLVPGANRALGAELVDHRHAVKTRLGDFLRETRLDELPQLVNVLCGEMTFFGPRPVRPEVYAETCTDIPQYDVRFDVKPGLVGYSQLYTPHGAPKRLRARIDNRAVLSPPSVGTQVKLLAVTGWMVLRSAAARVLAVGLEHAKLRNNADRRSLRRVSHARVSVRIGTSTASSTEDIGRVVDINERAFLLRSSRPLSADDFDALRIRIEYSRRSRRLRAKEAKCRVELRDSRAYGCNFGYVFEYEPASANSRYVIDQYLLEKSVVPFRRARVV